MEGHVAYTPGLGLAQAFTACIAAVGGFDDEIEDQSAPAGGQIELMSVVDAALDDDVGMRFEQADKLLAGRRPPLGLGDDLRDQWLIVANLACQSLPVGPAASGNCAAACCR